MGERALAELSHCGRNAALRSVQSGRARTASYAHGRSASVACGLGQLKVALRPRSPSSQSGASRIEWKFDFSCREWMDCLVECKQLGSAGSMRCNTFSGRQQTRARERVLNWTLRSNTPRYTRRGVHVFYSGLGFDSALWTTKPKTVRPGLVFCVMISANTDNAAKDTSFAPQAQLLLWCYGSRGIAAHNMLWVLWLLWGRPHKSHNTPITCYGLL